ncbi:GAF domain-containing sensor histidine kinase [Acaryochloris thomasi]|nr:ATP-binding protein [Acaryochloris thomasi]
MPASTEFVTLCRSQVSLLIQGVGASMSAVYLTEGLSAAEQTSLVPVVVYPEETEPWPSVKPLLPESEPDNATDGLPTPFTTFDQNSLLNADVPALVPMGNEAADPEQLVLPLIQDEVVLGLLVVAREQQQWSDSEQSQIQQVAETLALACVMDQRSQWLANASYRQRLLQADQKQTLSDLMHQFRSPLTALRTLGKLLTKRFSGDEQNRPLAESIVQQSERLEELLQQFDGAVDIGEAALEPQDGQGQLPALMPAPELAEQNALSAELLQPCWVADILSPLINAELGVMDEKQLHLSVHIPEDLPPVRADASALREVLGNLIDNAFKYTPAGGEVRIKVRRSISDASQVIAVSDNGPGIPPEDLAHVFERHYRGVQAETEIPGTGLGLAIASTLIQEMQGRIEVFSPAIDNKESQNGSTFLVTLPEC